MIYYNDYISVSIVSQVICTMTPFFMLGLYQGTYKIFGEERGVIVDTYVRVSVGILQFLPEL